MKLVGGAVFDPVRGFAAGDLCIEGERIAAQAEGETLDVSGCWVIPGLTDLHFHGCVGADFSDGDPAGLAAMADYELSRGVTQICPAAMTLPPEQLEAACSVAAAHKRTARSGADLVGVNLEGPFLSPEKKGAQNGAWLRKPDLALLTALLERSEGLVRLVTVAPELDGAEEFIRGCAGRVAVSLGHTAADYDTAMAAFRAGARQVTHTFNAMPPFGHREPGVVGAAADSPEALCELICDGVHVHPAAVRGLFRLMGADRVILISDTMRAAGLGDGDYTLGGQAVCVTGNRATLADGTLAGSVTDLMSCLKTAVSFGIPLTDAVTAAAVNPARALGVEGDYGTLEPGKLANVVVLNASLEPELVIFHGEPAARRAR